MSVTGDCWQVAQGIEAVYELDLLLAVPAIFLEGMLVRRDDDNAAVASREVFAYWSLGSSFTIPDGSYLTLQDLELRLTEP